jgi:hypothetical protein
MIFLGPTEEWKAKDVAVHALASPKNAKTEAQHPTVDD